MDRKTAGERIKRRVHELYYGVDMNCARTTLTIVAEILSLKIEKQTMDSALGLHGAGGYRAQCGLVEGGLMLIGIYGKANGMEDSGIVAACRLYAEAFEKKFGDITCRGLRPNGFTPSDPPHLCEGLTVEAISFTLDYLLSSIPGGSR